MDSEGNSWEGTELHVEVSCSSGFKECDDHSPNSQASMDELMFYLDTLEEHANVSVKQSQASELHWLKTLQERDDVIRSNTKSIEDLQRLNDKLKEENEILKEQLLLASGNGELVNGLKDDATSSQHLSLQLQGELLDQNDTARQLREHNTMLAQRLIQSGNEYTEIFRRLRHVRKSYQPGISDICKSIESRGGRGKSEEEQKVLKNQVRQLCELYDKLIDEACNEFDERVKTIELMEQENLEHLRFEPPTAISSPRKSGLNSSVESERYYTEMLATLEKSNRELRQELEQLQKDLTAREQGMFNDTLARMDNSNKEQMDKMKTQLSELSQELSLMNVDNRALRERLLRTENENEALQKKMSDSALVDKEVKSLQENLDSQLKMHQVTELKIKELELIKSEHTTICETTKKELREAKTRLKDYEKELSDLREKLREAKDMQLKFDYMNHQLNSTMERLHTENVLLSDDLTRTQKSMDSIHLASADESKRVDELQAEINRLEKAKSEQERKVQELAVKLSETEKQKHNANLKVKALRERLKTLQDSWQALSSDTETSFTALRDQYQQQIKEYKSIIDSLKSQNSSLTARIETMKKVSDQHGVKHSNQVAGLEQQISEYKEITEGYREENIVLRKELRNLVDSRDNSSSDLHLTPRSQHRFMNKDEFAKLRDILTTAKTEVESLQHTKTPRTTSSQVENESYLSEKEQTRRTVQELRDKYERISPVEQVASPEKSWKKYIASSASKEHKHDTESGNAATTTATQPRPSTTSSAQREKSQSSTLTPRPKTSQPISTPRSRTSATIQTAGSSAYTPIKPFQLPESMTSRLSEQPSAANTSRYDSFGNRRPSISNSSSEIKVKTTLPFQKAQLAEAARDNSKYSVVTSTPRSKTKEVVELKHRNSAELDLSKAFKPIEPDGGLSTSGDNSYRSSSYKPAYSSTYKYSSATISDKPYKPVYPVSSYKPSVHLADKTASSYKSSMDSAYGSLTKSSSNVSSLHTAPFHKRDVLPTIAAIRSKYSSSEMLSKLVNHENRQTRRLNHRIDKIENSVRHVSLIAEYQTRQLLQSLGSTGITKSHTPTSVLPFTNELPNTQRDLRRHHNHCPTGLRLTI